MSTVTPPAGTDTAEKRARWFGTISADDQSAFLQSVFQSGAQDQISAWLVATKRFNNNPSKYTHGEPSVFMPASKDPVAAPVPPAGADASMEARIAWLRSLPAEQATAFYRSRDDADEKQGPLGGHLNHTIFSGFNNPQDRDPWIQAYQTMGTRAGQRLDLLNMLHKGTADQADVNTAVANGVITEADVTAASNGKLTTDAVGPGDTSYGASSLAPTTATTGTTTNTDLLTDPVASAFSAAQLDQDFQVDTGSTTSAYRGTDLQSGVPVQASAKGKLSDLYNLDQASLEALQGKLRSAGYLTTRYAPGVADSNTMQGYLQLLVDTARQNKSGNQVSPDELLDHAATAGQKNNTQTQISLTDPLTAKALIHSALTSALGRAPEPGDVRDFFSALTNAEKADPSTSTSTQNEDGSVSTTTSGGVDAQAFAADYVQQTYGKDIGTFNAATTLYDAALSTLGIGGRGGV